MTVLTRTMAYILQALLLAPWRINLQVSSKLWRTEYPYSSARNYRPSFYENKPKTLVLYHWRLGFWACFHENWVYNFGHSTGLLSVEGELYRRNAYSEDGYSLDEI